MHKYIIFFFSALVFLSACIGNDAPEGTIPEPQMVSLLTDIHLTDGALYAVPQTPDSLYKYGSARYKALFKRYKISDAQFKSSLKYYTTKPLKLIDMYDKVSNNIKGKIDSLTKSTKTTTAPIPKNALPAQ
jgi:hypothetical protein